jgi:hypothetical protein
MRIGFDLDGTVADMQAALIREARALFPGLDLSNVPRSPGPTDPREEDEAAPAGETATSPPAAPAAPASRLALTSRQHRDLWNAACARENFWETLAEIEPGALARLFNLTRERRWEVIFITSRPETKGDTAQAQSHRWLVSQGFAHPSVFVAHGSRGKIAAALDLDVVVDDRPENCLDVAIDSKARAILVWRASEDPVPASARQLGIGTVASIRECLDILEALDSDPGEGSLLDRLKRLLGLKSRADRPITQRSARTL